jgi:glycerol-3-phosphate acyltransferase PlsX
MRIGIDAMGGDFAPVEAVKGVILALEEAELDDLTITLIGDESVIRAEFEANNFASNRVKVVHASEVIEMSDNPTRAVSQKRNSSISVGTKLLAAGELDAFAGAGNTGAMMVASLYTVKTIEGIIRPALTTIVPQRNGSSSLMLDVGANADVKPDTMVQFALLGSEYAQDVFGIDNPRVGLLSIGEEKGKGNMLTQAVHGMLEDSTKINFIGNIEGRHMFTNDADVIVCDGFTGNVVLKACEGMFYELKRRKIEDEFLDRFNFENYGGTAILGINKPVIIGHGISKAETFLNMIRLSRQVVKSNLAENIKSTL